MKQLKGKKTTNPRLDPCVSRQYGGWWTSVRGWDGWVWPSTSCSAPLLSTTSLRCTLSAWSTFCKRVGPARPPLLQSGTAALVPACQHFLHGPGHRFSCCRTCSSSSSSFPAPGPTHELWGTAYFLSALHCSAVAVATWLHGNRPITGNHRSSTREDSLNVMPLACLKPVDLNLRLVEAGVCSEGTEVATSAVTVRNKSLSCCRPGAMYRFCYSCNENTVQQETVFFFLHTHLNWQQPAGQL